VSAGESEGRRGRLGPRLNRTVGFAAGGTLALALLVCGCVFAAMAGPAISLHTRSEALHQTMAGLASTTKAVQVTANWSDFANAVVGNPYSSQPDLTASTFAAAAHQVRASLAATPLPLGPGAWAGLSANPSAVSAGAPPRSFIGSTPPKLEVLYRDPLLSNAALVAGTLTGPAEPSGTIAVAATPQTAARFALHPGSRLALATGGAAVALVVTAIVRQKGSGSTFWQQDPVAGVPSLAKPAQAAPYWVGGLLADPDQLAEMQNAFFGPGLEMDWEFPLAVGGLNADQVQGLYDDLNRATRVTPTLTSLEAGADNLVVASPLASDLTAFLVTQAGIQTVLLLLYVSLIVIGAAVILLAARIIVLRRDGELVMLRARGGSLQQVAAVTGRGALVAALPAAVIGAWLAIAVVPGGTASLAAGWWLAVVAVAVALAGPPLIAAWVYRKPAPAANPALITTADTSRRRRRTAWRRPVVEVTACAAAVAGLVVLHDQGQPAGGQINLFVTAAPVLVAIPVVVVMLRLYPLAVSGLFRLSARGTGATGFVAMSRATRSSLTGVLPAFALVLALCLATFAGMVSNGIARGETAASWETTGADALIQPGPYSAPVTPAVVNAIERVRGVSHATGVWNNTWVTPFGQPVAVAAVDPAGYAAVVATTPFPSVPVARIAAASPSAAIVPVLASPAAAAILGRGTTQLTTLGAAGQITVRVTGILDSTPAQPGGGAFAVMALQALSGPSGQPVPDMILVAGSSIDHSQLSAVVNKLIAGSIITYRASVLASLNSSPLQHGAALIVVLTLIEAAVLGLFIVLLGLALGSADRELTVARLTVMGHQHDTGLVMAETLPAVITAVVAGVVCAVVLPHLIGPSIDLSAFTGTSVPVQFQPDVIALGLPAAAVLVLAVAALAAEARTLRRRGVTGMLRVE
jgi:putative ABC transport system permease protein